MEIKVIASTKPGNITSKEEFNEFSGHCAGVCYMADNFETLMNEDKEKTNRRIIMTKSGGHHSVFDHNYITLELEDIPKLLAMLINNEKMYTTSEKSARYTRMKPTEKEEALYNKWQAIFEEKILAKYPEMNPKKVTKLAQENSRYLISVLTKTTMIYTVSYRQLNYIYGWVTKLMNSTSENRIVKALIPSLKEFKEKLETTGYIEEGLYEDNKSRGFSLIYDSLNKQEYFGDVYCTTYKGSFAEFAQAQRHRTISYEIAPLKDDEFFVPPIIEEDEKLKADWICDIKSVADLLPQGMMVLINERGTYENFILKLKERICTNAQLEICNQSRATLLKYQAALEKENHPLKMDIARYTKGARCTFGDFKCTSDCGFNEGKTLKRLI
ncbi:MAG: FAD-dependent thymidylate synthase [Clostridia bacterium]|nr:FAD-dependent thymidylate synthase [Clostridia bacterium]